jgi:hypothetical protein
VYVITKGLSSKLWSAKALPVNTYEPILTWKSVNCFIKDIATLLSPKAAFNDLPVSAEVAPTLCTCNPKGYQYYQIIMFHSASDKVKDSLHFNSLTIIIIFTIIPLICGLILYVEDPSDDDNLFLNRFIFNLISYCCIYLV